MRCHLHRKSTLGDCHGWQPVIFWQDVPEASAKDVAGMTNFRFSAWSRDVPSISPTSFLMMI